MENVVFSSIPLKDFQTLIRDTVKEELGQVIGKLATPPADDELITLKQACEFLQVSKVTLHKWKKAGSIQYHRFGNRIRFKKSELLAASQAKRKSFNP